MANKVPRFATPNSDYAGDAGRDYTYDVYGQVTGGSGSTPNEFDFAGQQSDGSTGLQYLRALYYDPATGVFISRDPLAAGPGWLGNPHGYVDANPTNLVDPLGLYGGRDKAQRCMRLYEEIQRLTHSLNKRIDEFRDNPLELFGRARKTHMTNILINEKQLRKALDDWKNCPKKVGIGAAHPVIKAANDALGRAHELREWIENDKNLIESLIDWAENLPEPPDVWWDDWSPSVPGPGPIPVPIPVVP